MTRHTLLVLWMFVGMFVAISTSAHADTDTLEAYAQKCDQAIGVTVPDFNSDDILATEVPTTHFANGLCDRPNVLNGKCDPGSRFRVLINNNDAYVVAHSRKKGQQAGHYGDIAVIQHNKKNGATCFYQGALGDLSTDGNVKAPSKGVGTPAFWMTPSAIATSSFPCAGCHDNGPIIRSPYLAQITGPNKLPGAGDFSFNSNQPYSFVGSDFASWKAYKVEVAGNLCNTCHRMGVNNLSKTGTARILGIVATNHSQINKNPHSVDSPIWMPPGQVTYSQGNADAAMAIKQCADQFHEGSPLPNTPSCKITQFTGANLYDKWSWANQGKPAGVTISGPVGVLTMMDTPTSVQRPYVFVRGSDGNLWVNWWR